MSYNKNENKNNVSTYVTKDYSSDENHLSVLQNSEYSNQKKNLKKQVLTENSFSQDEIDIREVDSPDEITDNNLIIQRNRKPELNSNFQEFFTNKLKHKRMSNNAKYNGSDNYGIVPRVGSKSKTIVIQDEEGNELSRIVSSSKERKNYQFQDFNANENFSLQPNAMNTLVLQPNSLQPYVMQPTPTPVILQPPGYFVDPNVTNQVFYTSPVITTPRAALSTQIIPEEPHDYENESSKFYRKLTGRGRVADSSSISNIDPLNKNVPLTKRKINRNDYIYCCTFCEPASNDTCHFCWRICAFPTWWAVLIFLISIIIIGALIVIIALFGAGTI